MKPRTHRQEQTLTVADLCRAIEAGLVPTTIQDGAYVVKRGDLRRLRGNAEIFPTLRELTERRHAS